MPGRCAAALALLLAAGAQAGDGLLRVANPGHPASLDPHRITGVWENRIVGDMLIGLTTEGPDGSVQPGAAESWEVSEDGRRYRFRLREHRWSDGTPVTAEDFAFSFRRMLSPEDGSPYANFFWVIEGARAYTAGDGPAEAVGVQALDERRLEIRLTRPVAYFPGLLMHFAAFPVPRHALEAHGDDWTQPGNYPANGAFVLDERVPNAHVSLRRNERFFDAEAVTLDGVRYDGQEDRDGAVSRFRAGEVHVLRDFPAGRTAWLRDNLPDAVRTSPYLGLTFFAVNHRREALQDARVRRALSKALDRDIIAGRVLDSGEQPALSLVPEGSANYGEPARPDWHDTAHDRRVERARELLREAGWDAQRPLELQVRYPVSENERRVALAAQSMWREIGVQTELTRAETAVHYSALEQGDFDLGLASWLAVYDDPQTFTLLLETQTGSNNFGAYSDSRYDELTERAAHRTDVDERAALLREAEALAMDEQALIPVYHHSARNLVDPAVTGWQDNRLDVHRSRYLGLSQ